MVVRAKGLRVHCYYRGLNNYLYYFGVFLIISIVKYTPKRTH